jgi:N-acetylneuraminic acid mutarotase
MKNKSTYPFGFFNLRVIIALLVCMAAVCEFVTGTVPAFLHPKGQANASQRTLTFEERVSNQRAIEEVYWRHRIWPKERKDPKPSLDAVMSQAQLEKKVENYLRNSQALEDYWQRPITVEQLQAEMDRMAKNTKQPEVLRELFDSLGNDPFVIAESLARPALAERLLTNWYAYDQRIHGELRQRAEAELQAHPAVEQMKHLSGTYSEIEYVKSDSPRDEGHPGAERGMKLNSREWDETVQKLAESFGVRRRVAAFRNPDMSAHSKNAAGQEHQTIPIGEVSPSQEDEQRLYVIAVIEKTADRLKLATVSWRKEPRESWLARTQIHMRTAMPAPSRGYTLPSIADDGCTDDTWRDIGGPPDGRWWHTAIWTGSEMIVWGGFRYENPYPSLNTGGRYSPSTDSWIATSPINAPAPRYNHTAVWTGSEMIVWGGTDFGGSHFNTGGRYDPGTDSWTATSTATAPTSRESHTAIWTGGEMIVWGGYDGSTELNTGARYNPGTDGWTAVTLTNAPPGRYDHTAVWTGDELIIWGGVNSGIGVNSGGRYSPNSNNWTATSTTNAPDNRYHHTAVWTGSEMIIWGGDNGGVWFNTGGRYNPITNSWTATSTTNAPEGRSYHASIWTGAEMIVWGGFGASGDLDSGGRYNPTTNSWSATSLVGTPTGRDAPTAVWSGTEMIVWGGRNNSLRYPNAGGRYDPTTNSWARTSDTPNSRRYHTGVWTGSEMIVWAGALQDAGNPYSNTGGTYNPSTDSWTATNTGNAPSARAYHTALWTGTEMIIWGGFNFGEGYLNTGGRYNPGANSWTATSITNAPTGRDSHGAVWTGSEMIIWGGYFFDGNDNWLNTGGKYNPGTNSWTPTSTTNAPSGRTVPDAVWTSSEMIVWGGSGGSGYLSTGGRYNPVTNGWTATSTSNTPSARTSHRSVWTGGEMIVWGGYFFDISGDHYLNTGGRYNPNTNSWTATSTTNAPDGRSIHTTVWTGNEMIVWGGFGGIDLGYYFNTGGRYSPGTDAWTTTNTIDAPDGRYAHTAVWTGSEMIVWAGVLYSNTYTGTGGRYCVQSAPTPTPTPCIGRCEPTPRSRPTPHVRPTPP